MKIILLNILCRIKWIYNYLKKFKYQSNDWVLFESFITHGELLINNLKSFEAIELNIVCLKLGGVPEFDKIYEKQSNNWVENKKDLEKYNPSEPKEDKLNKYNWIIFNSRFCNLAAFIISLQKEDSDWSSTKNEGDIYYWRRLKKIDTYLYNNLMKCLKSLNNGTKFFDDWEKFKEQINNEYKKNIKLERNILLKK